MAGFLHRYAPGNGRFFIFQAVHRVFGLVFLAALVGCSSSDPQIMQIDHYLVASRHPSDEEVTEALVVSVDVFDPDGSGELAELEVILADRDLGWTLKVEDLSSHEQDGQQWYTTPPLTIDGRSRLPRGSVQITVTDLSGRRDRREVQLPRTLPELTTEATAHMDASGIIVPADEADSLLVVLETADNLREARYVSGPKEALPVSRVFEGATLERLSETSQPIRVWLLHEWSPRMQTESGPWMMDPGDLPFTNEP
ncbi:MAG: hypothetical protein WD492_17440 [Alkalispirochaeta sp.]